MNKIAWSEDTVFETHSFAKYLQTIIKCILLYFIYCFDYNNILPLPVLNNCMIIKNTQFLQYTDRRVVSLNINILWYFHWIYVEFWPTDVKFSRFLRLVMSYKYVTRVSRILFTNWNEKPGSFLRIHVGKDTDTFETF